MRMLVKYSAYVDFDKDFNEKEKDYYLSFVKKDDVIDVSFESLSELKNSVDEYKLADFIKSQKFISEVSQYDDYKEFFGDVNTLVFYGKDIPVKFDHL